MADNIINFADIRAAKKEKHEDNTWNVIGNILNDDVALQSLLDDVMAGESTTIPWPDQLEEEFIFGESMQAMSRFLIEHLFQLKIDPAGPIADDMIFISMLFESAIREYKTGEYDRSSGAMNTFYEHFNMIRAGIHDDGDS
tara:strand:- start:18871 stop:19293 length:423 start_codon:yes stop_codon:yes gene_type:complete